MWIFSPLSARHIKTCLGSMYVPEGILPPLFPHLLVLWLFADKNKLKEREIMKIWWGQGRDSNPGILKLTWTSPPPSPLPRSEWWYRLIKNASLYYEKRGRLQFGRTERQTAVSGPSVALVCATMSGMKFTAHMYTQKRGLLLLLFKAV